MGDHRKIIHVDMDAFFAAVEMRDDPRLRAVPLVVGGSPFGRGVVSTANYEARKFGIHSAMPTYHAYKLCPRAVFVRPRFGRYKEISAHIRQIFQRYTSLVEPLSLDEAYLDVSNLDRRAVAIAQAIRGDIFRELGLTASAGVSTNKLVAKVASDYHKPNGITVVLPDQVKEFIGGQSVREIPGVGEKMQSRLHSLGIKLCRDAWSFTANDFSAEFGKFGPQLWQRFQGIDARPVQTSRRRKSLGQERTFGQDLADTSQMQRILAHMAHSCLEALRQRRIDARTFTIKVKYSDFTQVCRSHSLQAGYLASEARISDIIRALLFKTECQQKSVRLLGVNFNRLTPNDRGLMTCSSGENAIILSQD